MVITLKKTWWWWKQGLGSRRCWCLLPWWVGVPSSGSGMEALDPQAVARPEPVKLPCAGDAVGPPAAYNALDAEFRAQIKSLFSAFLCNANI